MDDAGAILGWPFRDPRWLRTIILTTHQATLAQPLAERTLTLQNGQALP